MARRQFAIFACHHTIHHPAASSLLPALYGAKVPAIYRRSDDSAVAKKEAVASKPHFVRAFSFYFCALWFPS